MQKKLTKTEAATVVDELRTAFSALQRVRAILTDNGKCDAVENLPCALPDLRQAITGAVMVKSDIQNKFGVQ